jgi:uncharacterized protein
MKNLILLALLSVSLNSSAQSKNFIDMPYIEVSGIADTFIVPNEIYIKIIISEKDTRDRISVEETESKMVDSLKAIGINTEKDLSIYDFGSNFRFYFLKKRDVIKTKEYIVKVSDAVMAGKVFMKLEDLDISNASIERVEHSGIERIKNLARIKAVENAKQKAVAITSALSQNIGPAIYISDNDLTNDAQLQGRVNGIQLRGISSLGKYRSETPKIEFNKIKVSAAVMVRFVLK